MERRANRERGGNQVARVAGLPGATSAAGVVEIHGVTIGTTNGQVLETIEGLDAPHGIAVDASGAIYVAQSGGNAILKCVKK